MKYITTLFLLLPILLMAQVEDDFTDGDFTTNPPWIGDTGNFEVDEDSKLHLVAPAVDDVSYLSTASIEVDDVIWEFDVEMDFNPSSTSLTKAYLMSSASDMTGSLNGYYVMIGDSPDEVSLYRQDGTDEVLIIDGEDDFVDVSSVGVTVQVSRSSSGLWELSRKQIGGGAFTLEGTVTDNTYSTTSYFGFYCKYIASRSDKFFFDNITVGADNTPPSLASLAVENENTLQLTFSEAMNEGDIEDDFNYLVSDGVGVPASVVVIDAQTVQLSFATSFTSGITYTLTSELLSDNAGNDFFINTTFVYLEISVADEGDVVINEIMADPTGEIPDFGIPDVEYLELFNSSSTNFDLAGWQFINTTTAKTLPSFVLGSGQFVILCDDDDVTLLSEYGACIGISSFTALSNSGDSLTLLTNEGILSDVISYDESWYNLSPIPDGGVSLERINPFHPCSSINNWSASTASNGGTPGAINSIFDDSPDTSEPIITDFFVDGIDQITIEFSEPVEPSSISNASFLISPFVDVDFYTQPQNNLIRIFFSDDLEESTFYAVSILDVTDCSGNTIDPDNEFTFGIPQAPEVGDILINEILFDPVPDGADFVELYNNSDKIISLKEIGLSKLDDGEIVPVGPLSSQDKLLFPNSYIVVTEDRLNILQVYPNAVEENIFEVADLQSYNNDEGDVVLVVNDSIFDQVSYTDDWHFELLDDVEAVSLERRRFDAETNNQNNWFSASEASGFATPGFLNSQFAEALTSSATVTVSSSVISPDNDGFQDVIDLQYTLDDPGYLANVKIVDDHARLVTTLTQNELLGTDGIISWDGIREDGSRAPMGIYIILVELFTVDGRIEEFKEVITVASKL